MKMCDFKRLTTITKSEMPVPRHIQNTLKKDAHIEIFWLFSPGFPFLFINKDVENNPYDKHTDLYLLYSES